MPVHDAALLPVELLCGAPLFIFTEELSITATEVALAKALFYSNHEDNPDAALRAFTEKVEALDE